MIQMIGFILLLLIYLYFESKNAFHKATFFKVVVSAYIAILGWWYTLSTGWSLCSILMSLGLTAAVPADYFLQFIKSNAKKYRMGILCFAAMHFFLLISYYVRYGFNLLDLVILTIILLLLTILQKWEKWDLGKEKVFLSIYTFFVALMSAKAISIGFTVGGVHSILIGLGGFLFILSDFILGIWDYYDNNPALVLANRFIYFVGQFLFATSLLYWL